MSQGHIRFLALPHIFHPTENEIDHFLEYISNNSVIIGILNQTINAWHPVRYLENITQKMLFDNDSKDTSI